MRFRGSEGSLSGDWSQWRCRRLSPHQDRLTAKMEAAVVLVTEGGIPHGAVERPGAEEDGGGEDEKESGHGTGGWGGSRFVGMIIRLFVTNHHRA